MVTEAALLPAPPQVGLLSPCTWGIGKSNLPLHPVSSMHMCVRYILAVRRDYLAWGLHWFSRETYISGMGLNHRLRAGRVWESIGCGLAVLLSTSNAFYLSIDSIYL